MPSKNLTTEVAIRQETNAVMLTNPQLQMIANTEFVPKGLRGNVPAVLACVARGRAMGIPDMVALNGIVVIEGKATLTAELMEGIVRGHGHSITGTVDAEKAVLRGKRVDNGDEMEATFTIAMADQAGLLGKMAWKKHPDDMLFARAVSKLCRRLFADCFAGATYVPEEVEITADELIDDPLATAETAPTDEAQPDPELLDAQEALLAKTLLDIADKMGARDVTEEAIAKKADAPQAERVAWLKSQIERAEAVVA